MTPTTQVDGVVKEEKGQDEASARALAPLLSASDEDCKAGSSKALPQNFSVGYRFFNLHLKSPLVAGQLDAQMTTLHISLLCVRAVICVKLRL